MQCCSWCRSPGTIQMRRAEIEAVPPVRQTSDVDPLEVRPGSVEVAQPTERPIVTATALVSCMDG